MTVPNHIHILLIASSPSNIRGYKVSHNVLYIGDFSQWKRTWDRPTNTTEEESGKWISLECFSTKSYTITSKKITSDEGSREWTLSCTNGAAVTTLKQSWYWRTPSFSSSKMDTTAGIGAELSRLWAEGRICYLQDHGTLYCEERNQQYGISNLRRIIKLDRGSTSWFIYDRERNNFRPVSGLADNEEFAVLKVEELEERMFEAAPSKAWENFKKGAGCVAQYTIPVVLSVVLGAKFQGAGSRR